MRNLLANAIPILLLCVWLSAGARAQSAPYCEGSDHYDGQVVHAYTNAGAVSYHYAIRARRGQIYNIIQRLPASSGLQSGSVPKVFTFAESTHKTLPPRPLVYYRKTVVNGRCVRIPTTVDLSRIIEREAQRNNIDPLLVEIVIEHESNFNPYAISRTGAEGLMQLMPGTASMLGVSDPFDPQQNVAGGVHYLAEQLSRFKDLRHALAAYNAGPAAVVRAGGVPHYAETMSYVNSIVAEYIASQS